MTAIRRLIIALLFTLFFHVIVFLVIAPRVFLPRLVNLHTEVVQISASELAEIKRKIQQNKDLPPLLRDEMHEKFRSANPPKDAHFMGAFNQSVPEEMIAGATREAPSPGKRGQEQDSKVKLSELGVGSQLRKLPNHSDPGDTNNQIDSDKPFQPVGREEARLKHGDNNLLNAVENRYYSFFVRFEEPIVRNWYFLVRQNEDRIREEIIALKKHGGAELPVTIEFSLRQDGSFEYVAIVESSSCPTLDVATRNAVLKLGSLPNPPPELFQDGKNFQYRLRFAVILSNAPVFDSSPNLRWY